MEASDYNLILFVVLLLTAVMIAVYILAQSSMELSAYKNLLNKGEQSIESKEIKQDVESYSTIYWAIVVAIYLGWSFSTQNWGFTWIVWPVAGVLSQIIPEFAKMRRKNK